MQHRMITRQRRWADARTQHVEGGAVRNTANHRKTARWAALAGAMAMAGAALVVVQLAGTAPASAVAGVHRAVGSSLTNSLSPKTARAFCDPGEQVLGGGGRVQAVGAFTPRLTLTQLQPVAAGGTTQARYQVTAAETTPGTTSNWFVQAYAICAPANSVSGYHIVTSPPTNPSSQSVQTAAAVCPGGERVIGTGGRILQASGTGQVVLQVARASATGDITRVQAHEQADGFPSPWRVLAYAVCVNPPAGYQIVTGLSAERLSESVKFATVDCPPGKRVHSVGAAITNTAPGNVSLQVVEPSADLKQMRAIAVENTPTSQNWDFIVVRGICAF